jgi:hypothetical protein
MFIRRETLDGRGLCEKETADTMDESQDSKLTNASCLVIGVSCFQRKSIVLHWWYQRV